MPLLNVKILFSTVHINVDETMITTHTGLLYCLLYFILLYPLYLTGMTSVLSYHVNSSTFQGENRENWIIILYVHNYTMLINSILLNLPVSSTTTNEHTENESTSCKQMYFSMTDNIICIQLQLVIAKVLCQSLL